MVLRGLANRIGSERLGICLDLGHAHIVAERRRTSLEALIEPVLDTVTLFHLHDNLGARWQPERRRERRRPPEARPPPAARAGAPFRGSDWRPASPATTRP